MRKPKNTIKIIRQNRVFLSLIVLIALFIGIFVTVISLENRTNLKQSASQPNPAIYYGAYTDITGNTWDDAINELITFEHDANKSVSIYDFDYQWELGSNMLPFKPADMDQIRTMGTIPMMNWTSTGDCSGTSCTNYPKYKLSNIINGNFDSFIIQWATAAKNWGHPFFLRFDQDMNSNTFPWDEAVNGNSPGQFVKMWNHVHNIFTNVGATNVTFVWTPNLLANGVTPLNELYPGDGSVNWVGTKTYIHPEDTDSFARLIGQTYQQIVSIAPSKPFILAELGATESSLRSKPAWLTDALSIEIPQRFTAIKAVVYANITNDILDYRIETSQASQNAFATAIASSLYGSNQYTCISLSPIPPPNIVPSCVQPSIQPTTTITPPQTSGTPTPTPVCTLVCTSPQIPTITPTPTTTQTCASLGGTCTGECRSPNHFIGILDCQGNNISCCAPASVNPPTPTPAAPGSCAGLGGSCQQGICSPDGTGSAGKQDCTGSLTCCVACPKPTISCNSNHGNADCPTGQVCAADCPGCGGWYCRSPYCVNSRG